MNLKFRVLSNIFATFTKPKLTSFINLDNFKPCPWYCLATETANLKFVLARVSKAFEFSTLIFSASSTFSSAVISLILLIS
jgi:hypothetical protein